MARAAAEEEEADCIICFEPLESRGGAVPLPCECRVAYCHHCWDRALGASVSACGRALCPSCRAPMLVDFDAGRGRLLFSRAPEGQPGEEPPQDDWRKRLYTQAKPMQIRLLQRFGASVAALAATGGLAGEGGSAASTAEPPRPEERAADAAAAAEAESQPYAHLQAGGASTQRVQEEAIPVPRCVCGWRLTCTSTRERVIAFMSEAPIPAPPSLVEQVMLRPPIVCDLCQRQVGRRSRVWTCENGRRTVLHAAAYDVCHACFELHAYGLEAASDGEEEEVVGPGAIDSSSDEEDEYYDESSSEDKEW